MVVTSLVVVAVVPVVVWSHNSWRASDDVHQQSSALAQKLVHRARAREHLRGLLFVVYVGDKN